MPQAKDIKRVSFEDLTSSPWAGLSVQIQLTATDAAGRVGASDPVDFILPERAFFNPLARALIEERKKLLLMPDDETTRNETANVMAGLAVSRLADFHGDFVILMALRAGAVRLILDRSLAATQSVISLLWQTAVRIEDGSKGLAEQKFARSPERSGRCARPRRRSS